MEYNKDNKPNKNGLGFLGKAAEGTEKDYNSLIKLRKMQNDSKFSNLPALTESSMNEKISQL